MRKEKKQKAHVTIPWKVKLVYASGSLGTTLSTVMLMGFSLYFYTEICGINELVSSTIILVAKIWDFINDPMMGALIDHTKSKEGKCRFYLKYASVPAGILLALCFIMPELAATGKIVWVAVTYTLQGMANTAIGIPFNTLMARITVDPVERAQISAWKGFFAVIANILGSSIVIPLVLFLGKNDMKTGFMWVAIIFGVIYAVNYLIVFWGTRGYEPVEEVVTKEDTVGIPENKQSLKASLKALFMNVPWLLTFGMSFILNLSVSIAGATMLFYFQYNLDALDLFSISQMVALGVTFLSCAWTKPMVAKFGSAKSACIGTVIASVSYVARFLLQDANDAIIVVGFTLGTIGQSMASGMIMLIILNLCITYGKWKTGVSNEAILVSGYSLSYKVGMAISTPIAGFLLAAVPYVANAPQQEQSVLNMWFYENTLFPAVGFIISMFFAIILLKYEKKLPQMRKEIENCEQG